MAFAMGGGAGKAGWSQFIECKLDPGVFDNQ